MFLELTAAEGKELKDKGGGLFTKNLQCTPQRVSNGILEFWDNGTRPGLYTLASTTGKDPDAGKEWKQKEKGAAEDEIVR